MRVHYMSDLHLERADFPGAPPKGEVLVLAGDVLETRLLDPTRRKPDWRARSRAVEGFLESVAAGFDRVFYITGNHEYYGSEIGEAHKVLRRRLPERVTWLENDVAEHQGVAFFGAALWSDFAGGDATAMRLAGRTMSDFAFIRDAEGPGGRFTPEGARRRFAGSKAALEAAAAGDGPPMVVLTHHCPSVRCVGGGRLAVARLHPIRHAFYTDLEGFIRAHPRLRAWICGHTHRRARFSIGACRVAMNPRGYFYGPEHPRTERVSLTFSPETTLDLAREDGEF